MPLQSYTVGSDPHLLTETRLPPAASLMFANRRIQDWKVSNMSYIGSDVPSEWHTNRRSVHD